jgi:hypothetical protein
MGLLIVIVVTIGILAVIGIATLRWDVPAPKPYGHDHTRYFG